MHSRRQFLLSASMLAASSIAGCLDDSNGTEDTEEFSREEIDWIAASVADEGAVEIQAGDATGELPADPLGLSAHPIDADAGAVEHRIEIEGSAAQQLTVLFGDFSAAEAKDSLSAELTADSEYGGFDRYTEADSDNVIGLSDGAMVSASTASWFEAAIDASRGEGERLVDVDDDVELVTESVDDPDQLMIDLGSAVFGEQLLGFGFEIGPDESTGTGVAMFETEQEAQDAKPEIRETSTADAEIVVDGRTVMLTETVPTDELVDDTPDNPAPNVALAPDYTTVDGRLEAELLVNSADADVDPDTIYIRGSAVDGSVQWSELETEIAAGQSVVLRQREELVSDLVGEEIRVVFETSTDAAVLAVFEVPDHSAD